MNSSPKPTSASPGGTDRRRTLLIAGVGAVAVVLVGIVVALSGDSDDAPTAAEVSASYGPMVTDGAMLPPFASSDDDPATGMAAPRLESLSPAGAPVSVGGASAGEPTVIAFLAHWCPHCQREVPAIVELMARGDLDGIRVVGVLTGTSPDRPNFPPAAWLDREGWTGDVVLDSEQSDAARAYGLSGYPFLVFLDANGQVVARASGELPSADIIALAELAQSRT